MPQLVYRIIQRLYDHLLRPYLPRRLGYFEGYVVRFPKLFDRTDVKENMQRAEITTHRNYTRDGDKVVIVGVGSGVSTIVAAEEAGPSGQVIGYEAAEDLAVAARESMELNDVEDSVDIIGKPVTDIQNNIWGRQVSTDVVKPTELPQMDVLELDCEGAELDILKSLNHRPRVLSIEVHPKFGVTVDDITSWLTENGYEVINTKGEDEPNDSVKWLVGKLID